MSRHAKHRKAAAKAGRAPESDGLDAPARAQAALSQGRYREAVELHKELLKGERRPEWLDCLAQAYAGRAEGLAAKGMLREALALWHTRAELCGRPLAEGPYIDWLLQAGEGDKALGLLAVAGQVAPESVGQLETRLAAVALLAADSALSRLPADSALRRHRVPALAAIAAYGRGDFAAMDEQIQAIPFRSPYRDLRPLLKALAALPERPAEAAQALDRVPARGPFEPLAAALRVALLPGEEWLAALGSLDEEARQLVLDLKGCPPARRPLLIDLGRLGAAPAAEPLFDLLVRHRQHLPEGVAARLCRRLLPHAPACLPRYRGAFGRLSVAEEERLLALAAELRGASPEAEPHWLRVARDLAGAPARSRGAALVLRRLADDRAHCGVDGSLDDEAMTWLARSVELDPDDRDSHVRLVQGWRRRGDLKQARAHLEAALGRFPKDVQVLLEAVETALASGAFKKAVGLAKRVLELDPINPRVRSIIGHAHLSHARKHIKAYNATAAYRELDEAVQWLRSAGERGTSKLLRGLADERGKQANALLREGVAEWGGALLGGFHLALEARRVGHDAQAALRRAGVDAAATPSAEQVVALAHALNGAGDKDRLLGAALAPFRAALGRAALAPYAEADQLLVCEAFNRRGERQLLRSHAEAAIRRWPQRPVFVYLKIFAGYGDRPWAIPDRDLRTLERALDMAQEQGDQRTVVRIRELLAQTVQGFGPADEDWGEPEGLNPEDPAFMLELLLNLQGEKRFLEIARAQLGEQVFQEMRREIGGSTKQFARALIAIMVEAAGRAPAKRFAPPEAGAPPDAAVPFRPAPRRKTRTPPSPDVQKGLFDD
ncbi:MAG: tetratricopeptide repeat protein [Betaproteobacteria bacterium]|nr:tetratricopeptide repeat protein [Betaproteobacteria bacterium]